MDTREVSLVSSFVGGVVGATLGAVMGFGLFKKQALLLEKRAELRERIKVLRRADEILNTDVARAWSSPSLSLESSSELRGLHRELHQLQLDVLTSDEEKSAIEDVVRLCRRAWSGDRELGSGGESQSREASAEIQSLHTRLEDLVQTLERQLKSRRSRFGRS